MINSKNLNSGQLICIPQKALDLVHYHYTILCNNITKLASNKTNEMNWNNPMLN